MARKTKTGQKPSSKTSPKGHAPLKSALKPTDKAKHIPAELESALAKKLKSTKLVPVAQDLEDGEDSDEEDSEGGIALEDIDDTEDSDSENEEILEDTTAVEEVSSGEQDDEDEEDEGDIPLSDIEDLDEEEREDIIPHQRLTINNTAALAQALKSIALPLEKLPFSEHHSITSDAPTTVTDVHDDLARELAFYKQSLDAVKEARSKLLAEKVPFSRPNDFFAEMVKSDEHMGKVKQKLIDDATAKKASAEAKKQRDLKKFGKQVQVAKQQERDKLKRDTLEKIQILKRKRQNADIDAANEEDMFDIALDDAAKPDRQAKEKVKRQKKDQRFGYGGKKRFSKSGDAISSADLSGFSNRANKAPFSASSRGKRKVQRPGKSKRHKI